MRRREHRPFPVRKCRIHSTGTAWSFSLVARGTAGRRNKPLLGTVPGWTLRMGCGASSANKPRTVAPEQATPDRTIAADSIISLRKASTLVSPEHLPEKSG